MTDTATLRRRAVNQAAALEDFASLQRRQFVGSQDMVDTAALRRALTTAVMATGRWLRWREALGVNDATIMVELAWLTCVVAVGIRMERRGKPTDSMAVRIMDSGDPGDRYCESCWGELLKLPSQAG